MVHSEFNLFLVFSYVSCKLEVRLDFRLNTFLQNVSMVTLCVLYCITCRTHKARSSHCSMYHLGKIMTTLSPHFKGVFFSVKVVNDLRGCFCTCQYHVTVPHHLANDFSLH